MCLGIPAKVESFVEDSDRQLAEVDVSGVRRTVNVGLVEEDGLAAGDWVLLHVGFAIAIIDEEEAERTYEFLAQFSEGDELDRELEDLRGSRIE